MTEYENESCSVTFEENNAFKLRQITAKYEEEKQILSEPIVFSSTINIPENICKRCDRHIYNPKHPICPECANYW